MKLHRLFRRNYWDRERALELTSHLEHEIDDNLARGMTPEEARRHAYIKLGNSTRIREEIRQMNNLPILESPWRDVKYALRQMGKSPGFAATVVLTLALGIGATTAIFSAMNAVLLRGLPVRNPQRLFYLAHENMPNGAGDTGNPRYTYGMNVYHRLRTNKSVFSELIAYVPLGFGKTAVRFGKTAQAVEAAEVSGNFFSGLGVRMAVGRGFTEADEKNHTQTAVLSYGFWTRGFNRNPDVVGRTLYVNGAAMTVIGVAGPHFYGVESGGVKTDVWVPLQTEPVLPAWGVPASMESLYGSPNWWALMLMARLRPGVTQTRALAVMVPLFKRAALETVGKEAQGGQPPLKLEMIPARGLGTATRDYEQPLHVLMGMVALVLLIACVNISMLMGARNASREREFAMRLALGARRWPLFRQLLTESVLLTASGAVLGWGFALVVTHWLGVWADLEVSLAPDGRVLLFTLGISALAALVFGLAPLRAAVNAPVTLALKSGGAQTTESRSRVLTGKVLVAGQMALCVALLFGAGLLVRTLWNYQDVKLGMQADQVLAFGAPPVGVTGKVEKLAYFRELTAKLRNLPGVRGVTLAENRPGSGWTNNNGLVLDGREYPWDNGKNMLRSNDVGPDFFRTMGIPVLEGRGITAADDKGAEPVAVVNETLAKRYFKDGTAIGHKLGDPKHHPATIVGVVANSKYGSADEPLMPMAWFCYLQGDSISNMDVEVRTAGRPMELLPEIRRVVRGVNLDTPLENPIVLRAQFAQGYAMPALAARLGAFFGGLAVLLVAVGLYGTLAYRVNRRRAEIGVRMALGAARWQVLWMVLRESLMLVAAGLAVGLPLAWFASKLMASMLYKLHAHDSASFAFAACGVMVIALAAAWLPARRAAAVDPMQALRTE